MSLMELTDAKPPVFNIIFVLSVSSKKIFCLNSVNSENSVKIVDLLALGIESLAALAERTIIGPVTAKVSADQASDLAEGVVVIDGDSALFFGAGGGIPGI